MREDIKDLWVRELRFGNISQLRAKLGDHTGARCCLGVLCDIAVEHGIIPPPTYRANLNSNVYLEYDDVIDAIARKACLGASYMYNNGWHVTGISPVDITNRMLESLNYFDE